MVFNSKAVPVFIMLQMTNISGPSVYTRAWNFSF